MLEKKSNLFQPLFPTKKYTRFVLSYNNLWIDHLTFAVFFHFFWFSLENNFAAEGVAETLPVNSDRGKESPSWANKVPPSLLPQDATTSAGSSPAGSRNSSPRKSFSPGKLEEVGVIFPILGSYICHTESYILCHTYWIIHTESYILSHIYWVIQGSVISVVNAGAL